MLFSLDSMREIAEELKDATVEVTWRGPCLVDGMLLDCVTEKVAWLGQEYLRPDAYVAKEDVCAALDIIKRLKVLYKEGDEKLAEASVITRIINFFCNLFFGSNRYMLHEAWNNFVSIRKENFIRVFGAKTKPAGENGDIYYLREYQIRNAT